jgi:AraC-like DNA-binding protein
VREALLVNLARPTSFNAVAKHLKIATRTLRRRLKEEDTSFRKLLDELRTQVAIKYLRDTDLTVEDIAQALDFSEAANFRHAFRRWTDGAPHQFRRVA